MVNSLISQPLSGTPLDVLHPINKGLVGYWPLNEGAGIHVADISGNGNHGTLTGMTPATDWVGSERGWALDFDGANDYVDLGTGPAIIDTGNFAVCAWIKTSTIDRGACYNQRDVSTANGSYYIGVDNSPVGKVEFSVYNVATGFNFNSNTAVNDGVWHQIVCQRINTTDGEIYIDGVFDASGTGTARSLSSVTSSIGRWNFDDLYFFGLIENVSVYNRALSADEILRLYLNSYAGFLRPSVASRFGGLGAPVAPSFNALLLAGD